ncbi:MAG: hypothetical protein ACTSQK_12525 [Candidatus Heimdallarchaeota archaeon]
MSILNYEKVSYLCSGILYWGGSGIFYSGNRSQPILVYIDGIDAILEYEIDFDYCKFNCEKPPYIDINIFVDEIYFVQLYYIYCNADACTFWLEGLGNSSTISILQIFEPNGSVARCECPILIKGVLSNFNYKSFTLQFISVNNYVYQNHTLESFAINM